MKSEKIDLKDRWCTKQMEKSYSELTEILNYLCSIDLMREAILIH